MSHDLSILDLIIYLLIYSIYICRGHNECAEVYWFGNGPNINGDMANDEQ